MLITGDTKSGKSWLTGLLCERLILHGYSLCVIDPEGDYRTLEALARRDGARRRRSSADTARSAAAPCDTRIEVSSLTSRLMPHDDEVGLHPRHIAGIECHAAPDRRASQNHHRRGALFPA